MSSHDRHHRVSYTSIHNAKHRTAGLPQRCTKVVVRHNTLQKSRPKQKKQQSKLKTCMIWHKHCRVTNRKMCGGVGETTSRLLASICNQIRTAFQIWHSNWKIQNMIPELRRYINKKSTSWKSENRHCADTTELLLRWRGDEEGENRLDPEELTSGLDHRSGWVTAATHSRWEKWGGGWWSL